MINKLSKEKYFNYDSKELLGVMRFDFYDGRLSNQWNSKALIIEMNDRKLIDVRKLQQELNYIQFTLIEKFNKVVELCNGTGYDKETLVYIELEEGKYVIKLIPVKDSYSYIYTYKR
ncbi:MAG: Phage protein [uncultured Clostridium sp.]